MKRLIVSVFLFSFLIVLKGDSLQCSGSYIQDSLKHGDWVCKNGNRIIRKEKYKNGVLISYIVFDNKGKIIETRNKKGKIRKYKPCGC